VNTDSRAKSPKLRSIVRIGDPAKGSNPRGDTYGDAANSACSPETLSRLGAAMQGDSR
jgi:hypothetical protein